MTLANVFEHVGIHLLALLSVDEKRILQTTSTFFRRFYRQYETKLALSFHNEGKERWPSFLNTFPQLQHLQVFPNTLQSVWSLRLHVLVTLNLSSCGHSHVNIKPMSTSMRLRKPPTYDICM